jgi:hypothetical protein
MSILGGIEDAQWRGTGNTSYLKLPVVALCATDSHSSHETTATSTPCRLTTIDMHTSELPINVTAHNHDQTLSAVGLGDCMINGVLNIYAVQRFIPGTTQVSSEQSQGKAEIFQQDLAWELPGGQSERGLACFLSSLRLFSSLTHAREMDESEQDAILHLIMLLTNFPPAVRAIHILMRGNTPRMAERAAIVQCVVEITKSMVPLRIIGSDSPRLLEGSRLLFGLILEKAKHLKVFMHNQEASLPYMESINVHELRNMITMERVAIPV